EGQEYLAPVGPGGAWRGAEPLLPEPHVEPAQPAVAEASLGNGDRQLFPAGGGGLGVKVHGAEMGRVRQGAVLDIVEIVVVQGVDQVVPKARVSQRHGTGARRAELC